MRKCKGCGLIWLEDFNVSENGYRKEMVDTTQGKIKERLLDSKDRFNILKRYAKLDNLCDIGCGDGSFLEILRQNGYKNIFGIDPNIMFCKFARQRGLEVFEGKIEDFSRLTKNRTINTITMFHLIEHLKNPKEILEVIYKNIKKGDKLIIETPSIDAVPLKNSNYVHRLIYSKHLFYFNIKNLQKFLTDIGFKVEAMGKRDFNRYNLNIRESLFRLGFLPARIIKEANDSRLERKERKKHSIKSFIKNIIRKALSRVVILFGRTNFIWVVAEK